MPIDKTKVTRGHIMGQKTDMSGNLTQIILRKNNPKEEHIVIDFMENVFIMTDYTVLPDGQEKEEKEIQTEQVPKVH